MKYLSTRGHADRKRFCEILLEGLAPDGGLYLPEQYPQVSRADLDAWRKLSYAELAFAILSPLPLVLTVALIALEALVAVLQAYVFATLTCIYLNDALHPGH